MGCVELDGERDQLKHQDNRIHGNRKHLKAPKLQNDADHQQEHPGVRCEVHRGDERAAHRHGRITLRELARMARLVACCGNRRDARAVVGLGVERDGVVTRVEMVLPRPALPDRDIGDAVIGEHALRHLGAGHAEGRPHSRELGDLPVHIPLSTQANHHGEDDECDVASTHKHRYQSLLHKGETMLLVITNNCTL